MENVAGMTFPSKHVVRWVPLTLAVTGGIALLVGIFVAVLSIPEVVSAGHPGSKLPMQGALYIGTNTCVTCHGDEPLDWSLLYKQTVMNPAEKPHVIANLQSAEQIQQIDAGDMVDAYTTTDEIPATDDMYHQNYVIKTEDGRLVLPQSKTDDVRLNDESSFCNRCHTIEVVWEPGNLRSLG